MSLRVNGSVEETSGGSFLCANQDPPTAKVRLGVGIMVGIPSASWVPMGDSVVFSYPHAYDEYASSYGCSRARAWIPRARYVRGCNSDRTVISQSVQF